MTYVIAQPGDRAVAGPVRYAAGVPSASVPESRQADLIAYGDFNRLSCYLASQRVDALARRIRISWRAVEHHRGAARRGLVIADEQRLWRRERDELAASARPGEHLPAEPPPFVTTTAAVAGYAGAAPGDRPAVRRRLFGAIVVEYRDLRAAGDVAALLAGFTARPAERAQGGTRAARWRAQWLALPEPVVPALVRPRDGAVWLGGSALDFLGSMLHGGAGADRWANPA